MASGEYPAGLRSDPQRAMDMSTDGEDRKAWVKGLATLYAEKVYERDPAFDAGHSDEEGRAAWIALAEIAGEWAERLLREYRRAQFEAIQDNVESMVSRGADTPQDEIVAVMDRLEDDSRIPWRAAMEPE